MEHIRFEHITKTFGKTIANNDVSFAIEQGEVLSILGENGSGKTTLLNVLGGIYQQDQGSIYVDGNEVHIRSPRDSYALGIGFVHQHYKLVEAFTAIENVVLALSRKDLLTIYDHIGYTQKGRFKSCSLKRSAEAVKMLCDRYGFSFEPNKHVHDMSIAEKQTLEIIKTLFRGVDTLILDEPTAVLTPQETAHLFEVVRNMKKDGKTIVIITHKLNEVLEISDRVVVFRKGCLIGAVKTHETNESALADMMVGKKVDLDIHRSDIPTTGDRLTVSHLNVRGRDGKLAIKDASFVLHGSEILGIAGISGSGQRELLEAIAGLNNQKDGRITFRNPKKDRHVSFYHKDLKQVKKLASQGKFYYKSTGKKVSFEGVKDSEIIRLVNEKEIMFYEDEIFEIMDLLPIEIRNLGIKQSFVPEDRLGMGLVGHMSVVDNILLRSYRKGKGRLIHKEKSRALAEKIVEKLQIKTPSLDSEVVSLSGGNIQKILVGREIFSRPKILMVAYPVRGLDINSSYLIYNILDEEKNHGTAIIYVGEDLDVMLALTDRILVLADGRITGIVDSRTATKEEIGLLMTGGKTNREVAQ